LIIPLTRVYWARRAAPRSGGLRPEPVPAAAAFRAASASAAATAFVLSSWRWVRWTVEAVDGGGGVMGGAIFLMPGRVTLTHLLDLL